MSTKKNKDSEIAFLCDREACELGVDCLGCNYTTDVRHAKNFEKVTEEKYMEIEEKCSTMNSSEDSVNHPFHYTQGDIETIDEMVAIFGIRATTIHCLINCFKYISRYKFKGHPAQDIEKALWYAKKAYSLTYPEKPYEKQFIGISEYEFDDYDGLFDYTEFHIVEARNDLINIRDNTSNFGRMLYLIKHLEYALGIDKPGVKNSGSVEVAVEN